MAANNILLMRKRNHDFLLLAIALAYKQADRFASLKNKLGNRMMKQLLNSVTAKYRDLSEASRSIICLSLHFCQIIVKNVKSVDNTEKMALKLAKLPSLKVIC